MDAPPKYKETEYLDLDGNVAVALLLVIDVRWRPKTYMPMEVRLSEAPTPVPAK